MLEGWSALWGKENLVFSNQEEHEQKSPSEKKNKRGNAKEQINS